MEIEVIRSRRKTIGLEIAKDGHVLVRAPLFVSNRQILSFVEANKAWIEKTIKKVEKRNAEEASVDKLTDEELKALFKEAKKKIPPKVQYYARLVGVSYGQIAIRCQKTKWGSCSAKGNLNFNVLLMLTPDEVLDSIIVHELCHRKEMNHSKRFYEEVYRVFPQYDACHKWLKKNGNLIMRKVF